MVLLTLDCVLTYMDKTGRYHFITDTPESEEKAARHGLNGDITLRVAYSIGEFVGKQVRIRINCAEYQFCTADGTLKTGVRVTRLDSIELRQ